VIASSTQAERNSDVCPQPCTVSNAELGMSCATVTAPWYMGRFNGVRANPVLVVGNTFDPATPYGAPTEITAKFAR
jgi:hypothetical protein